MNGFRLVLLGMLLSSSVLLPQEAAKLTASQQSALDSLNQELAKVPNVLQDSGQERILLVRHADRLTQISAGLASGSTSIKELIIELKASRQDLSPETFAAIVQSLNNLDIDSKQNALSAKNTDPAPIAITNALNAADKAKKDVSTAKTDLLSAEQKLRDVQMALPAKSKDMLPQINTTVKELNADSVNLQFPKDGGKDVATEAAVRKLVALSRALPKWPNLQRQRLSLNSDIQSLKSELTDDNVCRLIKSIGNIAKAAASDASGDSAAKASAANCKGPTFDLTGSDTNNLASCADPSKPASEICQLLVKLPVWLDASKSLLAKLVDEAQTQLTQTLKDPVQQGSTAEERISSLTTPTEAAKQMLAVWADLSPLLALDTALNVDDTQTKASDLDRQVKALRLTSNLLADSIEGSAEDFVSDSVKLYYFGDVRRMMEFLNPNVEEIGSLSQAKAESQRQKRALANLEADLEGKLADVNRYKYEVATLQEEQRQSQAKLDGMQLVLKGQSNRLKSAEKRKTTAQAKYDQAKAASDASPNDAGKTAALRAAGSSLNDANSHYDLTQKDYSDSKGNYDDAASKFESTKEDRRGLPQRIEEARAALVSAAEAVAQQRRKVREAAIDESDAFAQARDNAPYLHARAVASHRDPLRRVNMYAFQDQRVIYLRGKRDDITKVRDAIAQFDTPSPQARLTLWEMELNVEPSTLKHSFTSNQKASEELNLAAQLVDTELLKTRSRMAFVTSAFRDAVNIAADTNLCSTQPKKTLGFFDTSVLDELSIVDGKPALIVDSMPDPQLTTTVGEALLMTMLTCPSKKREILVKFHEIASQAFTRFPTADTDCSKNIRLSDCKAKRRFESDQCWPKRLSNKLGFGCDHGGASRSGQREVVLALLSQFRAKFRNDLDTLYNRAFWAEGAIADAQCRLNLSSNPADPCGEEILHFKLVDGKYLDPSTGKQLKTDNSAKTKLESEIEAQYSLLPTIYDEFTTRTQWLTGRRLKLPGPQPFAGPQLSKSIFDESQNIKSESNLRAATPREAAADELLKELIIAFEDDLDEAFVEPMLDSIREGFSEKKHIRLGTVNRTSVLATNRLLARVDARSSAALSIGEETDILQSVEQLAQIYLTAQTGGALAAVGSLKSLPHEREPEIYGITNNGTFEVRPVFDPSGQALRFTLDHVTANAIREPNGTVNPQFPHVERHTVNAEVQISNLELREISRFSSNSQLGIPTRYSGGVPILKDIPYVRPYVPLLGWFVRRAGRSATTTQSFIFGQSITYPTIADLIDLLSAGNVQ